MIKYTAGYKYRLEQTVTFRLQHVATARLIETPYLRFEGTQLTIKRGYAWDGPSGPAVDTATAMQGSLVHDTLYQLFRLELLAPGLRIQADREYERICRADGMGRIRATLHFKALVGFGGYAARPARKRKVRTAP